MVIFFGKKATAQRGKLENDDLSDTSLPALAYLNDDTQLSDIAPCSHFSASSLALHYDQYLAPCVFMAYGSSSTKKQMVVMRVLERQHSVASSRTMTSRIPLHRPLPNSTTIRSHRTSRPVHTSRPPLSFQIMTNLLPPVSS